MNEILVAGIGNIFLGDDAFGVEVVGQMLREPPIEGARIIDFGIRGMDLTYALCDERYVAAILVDAVARGEGAPGTLYVIEPDESDFGAAAEPSLIDAHSLHPLNVLRLARSMGSTLDRIVIVGCEPTAFNPETDMDMSMSPPMKSAIGGAIELIHRRIEILRQTLKKSPRESKGADEHEPVRSAF